MMVTMSITKSHSRSRAPNPPPQYLHLSPQVYHQGGTGQTPQHGSPQLLQHRTPRLHQRQQCRNQRLAPAPELSAQPAPVPQPTKEERDGTVLQQLGPYITVSHSSDIALSVERDTTSEQANAFLNQLPATAEVHFYSLSTTCTCSVKSADHAIAIEGASSSSSASAEDKANGETTPIKVLVVDFTQLEGVTDLQLNNIDFVVIEGKANIRGGEGANIVRADVFSQFIKLGADADTLDGGGGNDTVASRAGDDLLIGGAGHDHGHGGKDHDTVPGKTGRDVLSGGRGHDRLSGRPGCRSSQRSARS